MNLTISHSIDADEVAFALAGFSSAEARRFADDLLAALWSEDEEVATAFAEQIGAKADELAEGM